MKEKLEKILADIESYCALNEIEDTEQFVVKCVTAGFNIERYGLSPKDNRERENGAPIMTVSSPPLSLDVVSANVESDGLISFQISLSNGDSYIVRKSPSELPNLPLKKQRKLKEKING